MPGKRTFFVPLRTKALTDGAEFFIEGTASSSSLDRQGDTIEVGAIDAMAKSATGTTILLNHSHNLPEDAIGYITEATVVKENDAAKLVIRARIDETSERAKRTWNQIQFGFSHGLSIGAKLDDFDFKDEADPFAGLNIKALELFEVSVVTVPANQDCYVRGIAGEIGKSVRADIRAAKLTTPVLAKALVLDTTLEDEPEEDEPAEDDELEDDTHDAPEEDDDMPADLKTKKAAALRKRRLDARNAALRKADPGTLDDAPADTGAEGGTLDEQLSSISDALMEAHDAVAAAAEAVDDPDLSTSLAAAAETIDVETDHIDAVQEEVATQTAALADVKAQVSNEEKKLDRLIATNKMLERRKGELEATRTGRRSVDAYEDIEDVGERTYARMAAPRSVMLGNLSNALRSR